MPKCDVPDCTETATVGFRRYEPIAATSPIEFLHISTTNSCEWHTPEVESLYSGPNDEKVYFTH